MKTAAQEFWEACGVETVRPAPARAPRIVETTGFYLKAPGARTIARLPRDASVRDQVADEVRALREYGASSSSAAVRRICFATADRLERIIGGPSA